MANAPVYEIILSEDALVMLDKISNRITRERIARKIDEISQNPTVGKPLRGDFAGYRSVRAAAQRYRVIYRVEGERLIVYVIWLGMRREGERSDVYATFAKLLRRSKSGS